MTTLERHTGAARHGDDARLALIAHPSADLYGSDRQMLETVTALIQAGWDVTVCLPSPGPLVELIGERGARVRYVPFPVLRKSVLRPAGLARFAVHAIRGVTGIRALMREIAPDLVIVNTITIPVWLAASQLGPERRVTIAHVHEAEQDLPVTVQRILNSPLLLARGVIANSKASRDLLLSALPGLERRTTVLYNGVPGPSAPPDAPRERHPWQSTTHTPPTSAHPHGAPLNVVVVSRLAPRKGTAAALEAVAVARSRGIDARLTLCGAIFAGYEWFEEELRARADLPDLAGSVTFAGFADDIWPFLANADVVMQPSLAEPFGNTAVEAMHARRPLIASRIQGLAEIVRDGSTGLLREAGDAAGLAAAIEELAASPEYAYALADAGWHDAAARFSVERYHSQMATLAENFVANASTKGTGG